MPITNTTGTTTQTKWSDEEIEKAKQKILQDNQSTDSSAPLTSLYTKPLYYIENPTPYLKIKIKQPVLINDELGYEYIDLFMNQQSSQSAGQNNYIKSFKYDIIGERGSNITIEIEDTDQSLAEMLALKLSTSTCYGGALPLLEISYGWAKPDDANNYGQLNVKFQNTITAVFSNMTFKYAPNTGAVQITIEATADIGVEKLDKIGTLPTPYGILRQYPAITIAIEHLFSQVQAFADELKLSQYIVKGHSTTVNAIKYSFIYGIVTFLYRDHLCRDIDIGLLFTNAVLRWYSDVLVADDQLLNSIKSDITTAISSNSMTDFETVSGSKNTDITIYNQATRRSVKTKYLSFGDTLAPTSITVDQFITNYNNQSADLSMLTQEIILDIYAQKKTNSVLYEKTKNLIAVTMPIASEMYIHPLFIAERIKQAFDLLSQNNKTISGALEYITVDLIDKCNYRPYSYDRGMRNGIYVQMKASDTDYDPNGPRVQYKLNTDYYLSIVDRQKWCIQAKSFEISQTDNWATVFKNIYSRVFADITLASTDVAMQKKFMSIVEQNNMKDNILTSGTVKYFPLPLNYAMNVKTGTTVLDALEKLIKLYQLKENIAADNGDTEQQKSAELNEIVIDNQMSCIDSDSLVCLSMIDYANTSEAIFNQVDANIHPVRQAFSVGMAGFVGSDDTNIGTPDIYHINFPDVIEFEPDFDIFQLMQSHVISQNMNAKITTGSTEVTAGVEAKKLQSLENNTTSSDEEKQTLAEQVEEAEYTKKINKYIQRSQVTYNLNFENNGIYSGGEAHALKYKKDVQMLRQHLMISPSKANATLKVLGDASFNTDDLGKKIFIKVINVDGSLSIFTGFYVMNSISQELSAGQFVTTFGVMKDIDTMLVNALERDVFSKDNLSITRKDI